MTLTYQRFTAVLLLIYGSLFLSGIYCCLCVFWCAAVRMWELELEQPTNFLLNLERVETKSERCYCKFTGSGPQWLFFLFPKIKEILKWRHFDDIDDIRNNTTAALKAIPQNQFQNCFEGCTRRWYRCIASQGEYFEGDHGGIQQWGM